VEGALSGFADSLREYTLEQYFTNFFNRERQLGAGRAHTLAAKVVADAWLTMSGKLAIVSGKEILSRISEWSQTNYGASVSVALLMRSMKDIEVDSEVVDVLEAVAKGSKFGLRKNARPQPMASPPPSRIESTT
jgi:hypothetical protein